MNEHLSPQQLSALVDGELTQPQLADVNAHLAACAACTSAALAQSLLKQAVARAGSRYALPPGFSARIAQPRSRAPYAWAAIAAMLLIGLGLFLMPHRSDLASEILDQHIATLAANVPPQVVSSDRHTVKPWFQGKLPFSFNLPQNLPEDVTLDGANLTYLDGRPGAQLLYSIGKHHVSVFLQQPGGTVAASGRSGFHVATFTTPTLTGIAISDVEPARLAQLATLIQQAQ